MKKLIYMLLVFSSFFIGCQAEETIVENENLDKVDNLIEEIGDNDEVQDKLEENAYFLQIGALEFKEKFYNNGKNIFFVGKDTCPACKRFKPTVIEFANTEKINIYYVNTTNFEDSDRNIMNSIVNIQYIPTLIISDKGRILYNESGVKSYDVLQNLVKEYIR